MTSIDTGEYQTQRGSRKYEEKIYEYQSRMPFSNWPSDENESEWKNEEGHSLSYYTEDSRQVRDTLELPDGWEWDSEWSIAPPHRGTDKDGWEYKGLLLASGWAPRSRKSITRRRLWNRTRIQTGDAFIKTSTGDKYKGWEYAHISSSTYHQEHSPLFGKRRRRYLRKIKTKTQAKLSNPPRFIFPEHQQVQVPPRLYFPMKGLFKYELRVYLYQARDLYAGNSTGLSDPYCIVSFEHYSQTTREINQTLTPLWDHTCVFDDIKMFGSPSDVKGSPPKIMIEIFDKDNVGKDYLGYVECYPIVRINENQQQRRQVSLEETEEVLHVPFSLEGAEPVDEPKDPVTSLSWYQVTRYGRYAGQLLAAFELFLVDSVCPPPILERDYGETDKKKWWYTVPHGIRPEYETKTIKILCWGVRNLKKYRLGSVTSPFIKVECGGVTKKTNHIIDTRRNPNFTDGPIIMELKLPVNPLYCPPLNIYLYDKRAFGQKPLIGTYSVQITEDSPTETDRPSLRHNPLETANTLRQRKTKQGQVAIDMETFLDEDPDYIKDSRFDWWTKYRLAVLKATGSKLQDSEIEYVNENHDRLKLFHHELEKEPRFHNFSDVVKSYPLYRGKGSIAFDDPSENTRFAGTFKGHITVKRGKHTANEFDHKYIPTKDLCPVVIRVYVVEGIGLLPLDPNGKSDPYLRLSIGKCVMDDADNFVPNSLNPVFGKMFELSATLPLDHTLKIQVLDHDYGSRDDFIGQTEIDIENRFISRYRASCGIPETFSKNGPNHWRDTDLPTDILDWYCKVNGLKEPVRTANGLIYNYDEYTINHTDLKPYMRQHKYVGSPIQQIALALLRRENVLVHEHVETRTLENPNQPGISQGSLRMWVDIFPKSYNLPPPVDISPRKPEDYELRVIVYDVKDVKLADYNPVTDEEMSDIYVKGWLRGQEETQKTDVHYRSFDREGNFNYRFVFPFQYLPAEKRIVVSKRKFFDVNKTEIRALPYLTIQVWDNDKFKFDDHLGTVEFDLTAIQQGTRTSSFLDQIMSIGSNISYSDQKSTDSSNTSSKQILTTSASKTSLNQVLNTSDSTDNLFEKKRIRRWWPLADEGMIELELQILTKEEAELSPAGKGRDEPNMNPYLPPPQRPETSFFWLTSPLKTFKHIIWNCGWGNCIHLFSSRLFGSVSSGSIASIVKILIMHQLLL
ncbi:PREDICTED: fer-1-like protein 6 isoform X2 [Amphimedon queenslandica]|uniref:C2 domain-containing protein n=1 Tax=Amphimedon queenslandica TaxID=400682 RepID=A0AAN0J8V7_AMPQE|nr:PREDICTED: fer-1-like protein 6 isoform X2 [Amphimedon queenslandica]|eukprot:XP_019853166.1 PREDICTED: fer-1-like protein 6 isoform X2 [Amphimedon queenslandica]